MNRNEIETFETETPGKAQATPETNEQNNKLEIKKESKTMVQIILWWVKVIFFVPFRFIYQISILSFELRDKNIKAEEEMKRIIEMKNSDAYKKQKKKEIELKRKLFEISFDRHYISTIALINRYRRKFGEEPEFLPEQSNQ